MAMLPPLSFPPLTDNRELVRAIAAVTGEDQATVVDRLIDEETRNGTNVRRETEAAGIRRYRWSDELIALYDSSIGFVYGCATWNRSSMKLGMRAWIAAFMRRHGLTRAKALTFGDGLGIDSAFLAMLGCDVTYFEPSIRALQFARSLFERNGVEVRPIESERDLSAGAFDLVLCLDVLEHVPDPPATVGRLSALLRDGGYLIVNAPFYHTDPFHPTHLASNRRFSGSASLYRNADLYPVDARTFWDPIAFRKSSVRLPNTLPASARFGGAALRLARWTWPAFTAAGRLFFGEQSPWLPSLIALREDSSATLRSQDEAR